MDALELLELVKKGESSLVQFKEIINHISQLSQEFSALANIEGGIILIGVTDRGEISGLSGEQYHSTAFRNRIVTDRNVTGIVRCNRNRS